MLGPKILRYAYTVSPQMNFAYQAMRNIDNVRP